MVRYEDLQAMGRKVLASFGHTPASPEGMALDRDYRALWNVFDTQDGALTRSEFRAVAESADFDHTFGPVVHREYDLATSGGGDMTVADLHTLLAPLDIPDLHAVTALLDPHDTGRVTRSAYYTMWRDFISDTQTVVTAAHCLERPTTAFPP